jgi:hypothetical protein
MKNIISIENCFYALVFMYMKCDIFIFKHAQFSVLISYTCLTCSRIYLSLICGLVP